MTFRKFVPYVLVAGISSAGAQGLYNLAELDDEYGSSPLTYFGGITAHYDDNIVPLSGNDEDGFSIEPYIGASVANVGPRTSYDAYARLGAIYYFDNIEGADDDLYPAISTGLNINHQATERLRVTSSLYANYQLEPDYSAGVATNRLLGSYLTYGIDVAVGYRWTERLGTYTGVFINGLSYDDDAVELDNGTRFDPSDFDRRTYGIRHQFRYQLSPQTVATAGATYSTTDSDGSAGDSDNLFVSAGLEHRFNQNTIGAIRAGAQFRDVDGGESSTAPYVEASFRTQVNQQFALKSFLRYQIEDYGTSRGNFTYDENQVLRFGVTGTYQVSQKLSLNAGANYITSDFSEGRNTAANDAEVDSFDEDLLNFFAGFTLGLTDNVSLNGTYNYSTFDSDDDFFGGDRDYDRNRFSLGVSATF